MDMELIEVRRRDEAVESAEEVRFEFRLPQWYE
jgi:hypothetical protein